MSEIIVDAHLDMAYNAVVLGRDLTQPVAEIRAAERDAPPNIASCGDVSGQRAGVAFGPRGGGGREYLRR